MPAEALPPPTPDLATAIVGLWRLVRREDHDDDGRRHVDPFLGADPLGMLAFSATAFAAQFMKRDRSDAAAVPTAPGAAAANNSTASAGYDAYFGRYDVDVDAGLVTVHLDGGITAANIGHSFTRDIRVAGERLYIRLATATPDGTPITRTLTFERT